MLFWDDITIIWDENIVYFFNWEKKLFWTNKKFVYLIFVNKLLWYHPKITYKNIIQKDMNRFIVLLKTLSVPLFCQSSLTPLSSSHHPPKSCTNREKARCFVSKVPSRHLETLNHNLSQWEAQFVLFNAVCNCAI